MKTFKRALCILLSMLMVLSTMVFAGAADETKAATEATGFTDEDYLVVKGRKMYNKKGEHIQLKGVNLGAWLVRENWLNPDDIDVEYKSKMTEEQQKNYWGTFYEDLTEEQREIFDPYYGKDYDGEMIYDVLEKRFGREKAQELLNIFYDNWITEWDLDNIKEKGFNCVRVPFWYRNFYYDDKGTKILNENGEWDFSRLDWIVEECSKREIYVILDMHGAVGSQSDAPHSGRAFQGAQLYDKGETGKEYRRLTIELWQAIAKRYNGNPAVAMYDLLNEPMCDVKTNEIDRRIKNEWIYGILYDAVREVDEDHIITMEAIWTGFALPKTFLKGWKNIVYQVHFYNNSDFIFNFFLLLTIALHPNVPLMVGEFYPHEQTTWENCFSTMNKLDYSWMLWTYKATGAGMSKSDWCMYGSKEGFWRAKIFSGTYDEIAEAWSAERLNTETGFQDTGHYAKNVEAHL
ncbi:MAG: cellulase family glycosylhydrolase [Clostridia bacterium]|nr:cellulase family glycosylhydrolase [Clostridia bacterium]